jgi:hypothetical protein
MDAQTKYALVTFGVLCLLIVLTKWSGKKTSKLENNKDSKQVEDIATFLQNTVTQSKQYYFMAKQDQNPIISLIHLCMSVSKLDTLSNLISDVRANTDYNIDIKKFKLEMKTLQSELVQEINLLTPKMSIPDHILL